ncbi:MAG: HlyD family efflux transporter periplasmic adaptor subunit [Planctomycetota bacterium]
MTPSTHVLDERLALHGLHAPRAARVLARLLAGLVVTVAVALVVTPWQQTIPGSGRVLAFRPDERPQQIEALVDGRVVRWHVAEGTTVKAGDPIADLADTDPALLERIDAERTQVARTVDEAEARLRALEERISGLLVAQDTSVAAADLRTQMARDRMTAAERGLTAAEAGRKAAILNLDRQQALAAKGLTSTRAVELAEMEAATREADVDRARATLDAARREAESLVAELARTRADAGTRVDEARAQLASARSDAAKARADLTRMDTRRTRQQAQRVVAPIDGTVLRIVGRQGGEWLKAGEPLATIVPVSTKDVVELWVDGNDMPMVQAGAGVRLQFEGWPALQFSGWPSIAVGTFGGRVRSVDATDNGQGRFRVLVEADPADEPWPAARFLRQGVRANGWVLLNVVPVGYELWRQFNGFPPAIAPAEPGSEGAAKAAAKDK